MTAPLHPGPPADPSQRRPGGGAGIARRRDRARANRAALGCRQLQTALARRREACDRAPRPGDGRLAGLAAELFAQRAVALAARERAHGG